MAEEDHLCNEVLSFFRVLLPGFSTELPIPRAFVKIIAKERIDEGATLVGPNGKSWRVDVRAESDKDFYYFGEGWRELVESLELDVGYFLVFRYEGDMVFGFDVFDTNGCGKTYPSQTQKRKIVETRTEQHKSRTSNPKRMKERKILEARIKEHKSSTSTPERMKEIVEVLIEEHKSTSTPERMEEIVEVHIEEHKSTSTPDRIKEIVEVHTEEEADTEEYQRSLCAKQSRSSEEMHIASDHNASKIQAEIILGKTTYTGPYLVIPPSFRDSAGISVNDKKVNLRDLKGENWLLGLYHRSDFSETSISRGWSAFIRSNPLKIGDAYVIETASRDENGVINLQIHKRQEN